MKLSFLLLTLLIFCISCKYVEAEKISSEEFLEEELRSIDWNEVDTYPIFPDCDESQNKIAQKECFESTLLSHIENHLLSKEMISSQSLSERILMLVFVNDAGVISTSEIMIDSLVNAELPDLKFWLDQSLKTLPKTSPALKRGIPVTTQFTLPVLIETE